MTCSSWIGACWHLGYLTRCACIDTPNHDGACICPCGHERQRRCTDCTGDPCPCGRPAPLARPAERLVGVYPDRARTRVS